MYQFGHSRGGLEAFRNHKLGFSVIFPKRDVAKMDGCVFEGSA